MRMIIFGCGYLFFALGKVFPIIQVPFVAGDAVVAAAVLGPRHFFSRQQRFVQFFAMPGPDDLDLIVRLKEFLDRQRQVHDR